MSKNIDRFCRKPTLKNFNVLPEEIKKLFYQTAIQVILHNIGNVNIARKIIPYYNKLLFSAGICDRTYMLGQMNIPLDTFLPDDVTGQIKKYFIRELIHLYHIPSNTVYFYDDKLYNIQTTKVLGINGILVKNGINPFHIETLLQKKIKNSESVKMVLIDYDNTLTITKIRKTDYDKDIDYLVKNFLGGKERVDTLFKNLQKLEQKGVRIGIITMNVKHRIIPFLEKINWL